MDLPVKNLSSDDAVVAVLLEQLWLGCEVAAYLAKPFDSRIIFILFTGLPDKEVIVILVFIVFLFVYNTPVPGIEVLDTGGVWSTAG